MGDNPNYVELELKIPTRVQYSTVTLRRGAMIPAEQAEDPAARQAVWDRVADELTEMALREAERIATRVLRDTRNGGRP
ncbi:MAG TPA: hypothetical protein VMG99_08870 [Thermoplasmata archaeon]|nr:hypothetical protein [Thermoplasmata archaeon]